MSRDRSVRRIILLSNAPAFVIGAVAALLVGQVAAHQSDATKSALATSRIESAKKMYELLVGEARKKNEPMPNCETTYVWSRRWLDAELDGAQTAEQRRSAFRDHLARMKEVQEAKQRTNPIQIQATDYFCKEAELWFMNAPVK